MAVQTKGTINLPNHIVYEPQKTYFTCKVDWEIVGNTTDGNFYIINYLVTVNSTVAFELPFTFKTSLHEVSSFIDGTVIDTFRSGSNGTMAAGSRSVSFGSTLYAPTKDHDRPARGYTNGLEFNFRIEAKSGYVYPLESFDFYDLAAEKIIYEIPPIPSTISAPTNYIGFPNNIAITKYTTSKNSARCTSTITYSFAGQTGTIVSNYDGTSCVWNIPDSFADYMGGSISKSATLTCTTYYDGVRISSNSITVTVAIPASSVTIPKTTIGQKPTIVISKKHESCYSTLTYTFGTLSGTIVENFSGTSYSNWTVPTSFYYQMPKEKTKTCTVTCTTYKDSSYVGETTTSFTVSVDEALCMPTMNPIVIDNNTTTRNITGNSDILIRYQSTALCQTNAESKYGASITSYKVVCGSKSITEATGNISAVTSGTFVFTITDSRGFTVTKTVTKQFIEYFSPTCYVKAKAFVDGTMNVSINGRVFNGSFGANKNNIKVQYHYISNEDDYYGEWVTVTPTHKGDNYTCELTVTGLEYRNTFYVEARVVDTFNTYVSNEAITRATPIFDWSDHDFNFNVPVTFSAGINSYTLKVDEMVGIMNAMTKVYEFPVRMTAGPNYTSATGSAALVGNTLRCTMNLVRNSLTNEGNVANEKCCTISIEHGGKINTLIYNSIVNGQTGVVATFYPANVSQTYETVDFDIYLAATANGGTEFSCYFTMPVTLNLNEFVE